MIFPCHQRWSPYSHAAFGGHLAVMQYLEEQGAVKEENECIEGALFRPALTAAAAGR